MKIASKALNHHLIFTGLTMKNFLSVGNVTQAIKLNENGLTLILGANTESNGGISRNGAGKSTILQAISYAIYGKPLTKIKIPNLINNINGKAMSVTINFEIDKKKYRIERGKKPDFLKLYVDDEEIKGGETDEALGENRFTQDQIDNIVGMSHTLFKHIVALNTFTDPFLKMSTAEQRVVIEELLKVTQISQKAASLKKRIDKTKLLITSLNADIKAKTEANNRLSFAIQRAQEQVEVWETSRAERVRSLQEELDAISAIDFDAEIAKFDALEKWLSDEAGFQTAYDTAQREISLLEREAQGLDADARRFREDAKKGVGDQVRRLEDDMKRKTSLRDRHATAAEKLVHERSIVQNDIDNADGSSCVCCGQMLEGTDHLKTVVSNLEDQIAELAKKIDFEQNEIADLEREIAGIQTDIIDLQDKAVLDKAILEGKAASKETEAATIRDRVLEHAMAADENRHRIVELGDRPTVLFRSRDQVYKARQNRVGIEKELENELAQQNPHINQQHELRTAMQEIDTKPLDEANTLFTHQDFLFKILSNKESFIRKKIIDQSLAYLNSRMNHYLEKLGLPHEVQFQSDLSVDITNLGRDFDFEQLSRGEMNRVIMATSWAFRDIWESTNAGCNLLWVDELLDQGTDAQGVEAALGILKAMARDRGKNVFLISHREELQARIDRTLMVRKENGFTTLEVDGVAHE